MLQIAQQAKVHQISCKQQRLEGATITLGSEVLS